MSIVLDHPYREFIHRVNKPARYLGGEPGSRKKDWNSVEARMCLAFPDVYDIGMSHLGYKILYRTINDDPALLAERAYAPWVDMEAELRARGLPLVSLESGRALRDFDAVGFSLQFELTFTNILTMLDLGGIPLRSAMRQEDDPLVLAGGPVATHAEPIAPFIDAFVIGDGEELARTLPLMWARWRREGINRSGRLRALAGVRGVYVPSLYEVELDPDSGLQCVVPPTDATLPYPIQRALVDIEQYPFPDDSPVGGSEAIFERMSIEIARGCTEGCRFCQAGMIYRPVRERSPKSILETVSSAIRKTGYDEVSLTALSTADYSAIAPLVASMTQSLLPEQVSMSVSSLRAYGLDGNVLDDMQAVRAAGITFAPEAGTQRMRDVVNKNVTEEQLTETAERVFSRSYNTMKLYFMIGLPTEQEEDVREIARVGGRARDVGKRVRASLGLGGPPTVTVSVSTHVPKPHTPFQWCAMDPPTDTKQKQGWLREEARRAKVDLRTHDSDTSWLEGIIARGDRRLADVIEDAFRNGARFDSWEETKKLDLWQASLHKFDVKPDWFLGTIPVHARLPWDHIDVGLEDGFLLREYQKSLKGRLSPPCTKVAGTFVHPTNLADAQAERRKLVCYDCGVACDLTQIREERAEFLVSLSANTPRPPAAQPTKRPHKRPQPRPGFQQAVPTRYRFVFEKAGRSAYISHLDLSAAIIRAFRRADVPLYYTQGFHPKPDMAYAPALSLGITSLGEPIDVRIAGEADPESLCRAATDKAHAGLRFLSAVALTDEDAPLSRVIDGSTGIIVVRERDLDELGGMSGLTGRASAFLERPESVVMRRVERIGKRVNVRDFVRAVTVQRADDEWASLGFSPEAIVLSFQTFIRNSGSVKFSEVWEAVAGAEGQTVPWFGVRTGLGLWAPDGRLVLTLALPELRSLVPWQRGGSRAKSADSPSVGPLEGFVPHVTEPIEGSVTPVSSSPA